MEKKNIEVYPIEDVKSIRSIAKKGYNVTVNVPSYNYDVEFFNDEVFLLQNGKEVDEDGTILRTFDDSEVYEWINKLNEKYELM